MEKLPAIGHVACSMWKLAVQVVLDPASTVTGVSRANTSKQALVKAAKQIKN